MVFSNLQSYEKDAFFSLLDEYFSSRPEIFSQASESGGSSGSAASAVHRALSSNPEATSKFTSAALKHALPRSSPGTASSDSDVNSSVAGRVAAFSSRNNDNSPPPHRAPSAADRPSGPNLVSTRKFGDVDTTSTKNMFSSVLHSSANKNAVHQPPLAPAAFAPKKNAFAPPPSRQPAPPQRQQPEEEEEEGEWAEALYDYDSTEAGDLNIRENQRVLVTERTSDDWWTGEFNGEKGLFPASYVKIL